MSFEHKKRQVYIPPCYKHIKAYVLGIDDTFSRFQLRNYMKTLDADQFTDSCIRRLITDKVIERVERGVYKRIED